MEKNKKILVTTILIIVLFLLSYGLKNLYNNNKSLNHSGNESAAIEDTNSPDEKDKDNNDKKDNDGIVEEDTEDFDEQDNGNQKEDVDASDGKNEKNDVLVKLNQGGNVNQDVYINSYNQNYGPKKSSIKSTIDGDLYILEDQITIRNTKVRGTIYVDPGADATTHLENVDAYKVVVLSGADHSIYFENLTTDKLEIDSSSYVRVVVDKGTKIKATTVKSNSIIYNVENEDGTFGVVEILNDGEVILSGDFTDEVIVRSGVDIKTTENTQVENLKIETDDEDAEVKLSGKFKDIKVERPVKLKIVDDSIISNIVTNSDTEIFIDKDVKIDNLDTKKKEVSIHGLYVGNTFKLNPNIEDFNFDNEENINFKYVSEDETVVSVNEDGTVKGMNPGETNVKIKASNGEEEKTISVSITVVNAPPEIAILIANDSINLLPEEDKLKYTHKPDVQESRRLVDIAVGNKEVDTDDIDSYDKLVKLEKKIGGIDTAITNAINEIKNLPSSEKLKYTDKAAVEAARALVETALGKDGVVASDITNLDKLEALETRISEMNTAITNAINAIENLPSSEELKYTDKAAVEAARELVEKALGIAGVETSDITNLDKLETLETRIGEMNTAITNAKNAIENLPSSEELKYTDKDAVEAARAQVETTLGIDGVETTDITNLDKLETLETKMGKMNTGITNAKNIIENLPSIEKIKYIDKPAVVIARVLVNVVLGIDGVEATDITNLDKLETLETRISEMNTGVTNAINAIENLPSNEELKYTDKAAVEASRALVETALGIAGIESSDITNLGKLEVLETKISKMNTAVTNAINAIENLSSSEELKYADKAAVEAARTLVDVALCIDGIVVSDITNLDKLETLEIRISEMNTGVTNAINEIKNLPSSEELKYADKATVEAARALVNVALGIDGVETSDITNFEKLETLETRISEMDEGVTNAINAIENLPSSEELKYTDKAAVEASRALVETALGIEGVEASDITNLDKLETLETRIGEMNTGVTNAINAIENLPSSEELKYTDKAAVEAARALVETALGIDGVEASDIANLEKLETLENRIIELSTVKLPTSNIETNSEIGTDTEIILSSETESAAIYYTIDGSTPDKNSILYDSSIKINKDTTIKAIAVKEGMYDSEVSTFVYTVATGVVAGKIDIQDKEDDSNTEVTLEGISDKGKEVSRETKSDVNGDFTFTGVPAGDYIIKTYMDGYFVNTINVRVEENQEVTLDKELILYVERPSGSVKGVAKFIGNEDNSGIYVKVQTLDGEPLPNIIVLTDEQGNYTIDKIPVAEGENSSTYVLTAYPLENDGTMISDSIVVTVIKDQTVTISDTLWVRPKPDAVYLIADSYTPWNQSAPEQLINELGVSYTKYNSSQIASLELPLDKVVWILNDQPQNFYNVYAKNQAKFDKFVSDGGTMLFEACDNGWNAGSLENAGGTLPGGVINRLNFDGINNNINPTHPMMKGIPEKLYGNSASHNYFIGLPDVATILTQDTKGNITATEYKHDKGRVISTGQPLEYYWSGTNPLKNLYTNLLKYTFDIPINNK